MGGGGIEAQPACSLVLGRWGCVLYPSFIFLEVKFVFVFWHKSIIVVIYFYKFYASSLARCFRSASFPMLKKHLARKDNVTLK